MKSWDIYVSVKQDSIVTASRTLHRNISIVKYLSLDYLLIYQAEIPLNGGAAKTRCHASL